MPDPGEAERVARIGAILDEHGVGADLSDDCAHLRTPTALVSTDTLVEGVHFTAETDPRLVGRQAAVANLSDLAASGGAAGWLVWALCLPPEWDARVDELTHGFAEVAAENGARVVGGNLSRTAGPAVIAVTVGGPLAAGRPLLRNGGQPGDTVFVTGVLGDAALGYLEPDTETVAARHAWRPHLSEAAALAEWPGCHAAMDVSDGLLIDAARLARASGVGVDIDTAEIPVSALYRRRRGHDLEVALTGGEDYVLLFSASGEPPIPSWPVGRLVAKLGLRVDGEPRAPQGYDHLSGSS